MIYYYKIALCDLYELYRIHDIYLSHEQHQHVFLAEFLSQNQHHILYKKILAFVSRSKMYFKVTFLCEHFFTNVTMNIYLTFIRFHVNKNVNSMNFCQQF